MKTTMHILAIAAATALASTASALAVNDNAVKTTPLTGPYVGVYGGYDWTDPDMSAAEPDGWDGGVFVGYKLDALLGGGKKDYGIGANGAIEVFYGISNADDTAGGLSMKKEDEWGISFRPGISILNRITGDLGVNPYGIIGYRNTEFEASSGVVSTSDRYDGFELGIGTELIAFGDAGLRVEYAHTWYGNEDGVDPDSDDIRLGLSYHF